MFVSEVCEKKLINLWPEIALAMGDTLIKLKLFTVFESEKQIFMNNNILKIVR